MIFLDTNVVSEPMRQESSTAVVDWLAEHEKHLALSTIVLAEIAFGIFSVRKAERSPRWLDQLLYIREKYESQIHAFDEKSALIYSRLMGDRKLAGRPMSTIDGMIAAIALRHEAKLATRNVKHFQSIGLKLINPWTD